MTTTTFKRAGLTMILAGFISLVVSCDSPSNDASHAASAETEPEEEISPEDKKFLDAAKPFLDAIVSRDYTNAYALLSKEAKGWMSLNQFVPPQDDQAYERNRAQAISGVKASQFVAWMKAVEQEHGMPAQVEQAHVFSKDPDVLAGQGDHLDVMFAIGGMPKTVPPELRRASLRCQVRTQLSPAQLKQAAQEMGMTVESLTNNPDFNPYFNLKLVLVEEQNTLKVGYFEFLPPSMLD